MNIHESIDFVKSITMESSLSVMDTMIDLIDKNDLITEYSENDIMNDIIMESMMIFMESKDRERDKTPRNEISKWMEKKGYWYTGDNPKKKKECMRMYHFLQQHKFDPKDETYESDIKLNNGSNKRIKLNIDPSLTKEQIATMDEISKEYINAMNADVKRGKNAYYDPPSDSINISSKKIRSKQKYSQSELKHEEGHAKSAVEGVRAGIKGKSPALYNYTKFAKEEAEFLEKAINKYYINSHDESTEELHADKYSAINAKIRTRVHGNVRNLTEKDLKDIFMAMSRDIEEASFDSLRIYKKRLANIDKKINNCKRVLKFKKIGLAEFEDISQVLESFKEDTSMSVTVKKHVISIASFLDDLVKLFNDAGGVKAAAKNCGGFIKDLASEYLGNDKVDKLADEITRATKEIKNKLNDFGKKYKFIADKCNELKNSKGYKMLTDKKDELKEDAVNSFARALYDNEIKKIIMTQLPILNAERAEILKHIKLHTDFHDESSKMRYDWSKRFVKEYFEALYDDYYMINE